jgi:hypothetical protein
MYSYPLRGEKNKMKTDTLIKKLEGFRIDGLVSDLLSLGVSNWVYSSDLSRSVIYGSDEFHDEIDPELLRIIDVELKKQDNDVTKVEFKRAMSMVIIRRVLEECLMTIGDESEFGEDFTPWPLNVDDSIQKAYARWDKEFAHPDETNDLYLLYNTDLGNEMGKKAIRKIVRRDIAASEKAIEMEPEAIKHYIERGYLYWRLADYEPDPIKEAEYRKKAREDAETIRKLNPDDIRHDKHNRIQAYHFFSDIETDAAKAREYKSKAYDIRGLNLIKVEAENNVCEDKMKANDLKMQKIFEAYKAFLENEENRIADYVKIMGADSQTAEEWKEGLLNLKKNIENSRKYWDG